MKILNIIQRYPPGIGGSEEWCKNLCVFLAKKGMLPTVMAINMYDVAEAHNADFLEKEFLKFGDEDYEVGVFIKRYKLWKPWEKYTSAKIIRFLLYTLKLYKTQIGDIFRISPHSFELYRSLPKEIKKSDVVILHTLPYFHNLVGFAVAKIYKKIIIIVPHFHPGHPHYEKPIFYKIMNHCDAVITVSDYEKKYLISKKVNYAKILVTGNAIETGKPDYKEDQISNIRLILGTQCKIDKDPNKVIFLGRKEIYKGIFTLIEAMRRLAQEESRDLFLFLAGPDTPDFNKEYSKLNSISRLKIINFGEVTDEEKSYLLQFSDLLALPSKFEAFGIVFLEAWKYNKPVIGTNKGAMPDVIGRAGFCAEYGNVEDLKNKIKKVLLDRGLAERMGRIGREKVEKEYTIDTICGKVLKKINSLANNKKRVLMVSQLFPPNGLGGAEIVAYEQAKRLKKSGFEVKVFAGKINDNIERFSVTKENRGMNILRINLHQKDFMHTMYANFNKERLRERFREILYEYSPDIVHFHNIYALSLDMIDDCRDINIPVAMTLHDYWGICPKNLFLNDDGKICSNADGKCLNCQKNFILDDGNTITPEKRNIMCIDYYNKADLLISPSNYLASRYIEKGVCGRKLNIINNGIDTGIFKKIKKTKSRKIRFGYIGQIAWHKGIENLLKAASILNGKETEKISLLIAGSGEMDFLNYCKAIAKGLKFVTFIGGVEYAKIPEVFKKIDILIAPSVWPENSPHAILEAMASGTPVIASNIGGIPELIDDGINGLLFKYDDPLSLIEKIREVINNPAKLKNMEEACFKKAQKNNISDKMKIIIDSYSKVLI